MKFLKTYRYLVILVVLVVAFFVPALLQGKILLPSDTIVGLYHPYRDLYAATNPNGLPYKNALITDPVRQQYPWKKLTIQEETSANLPTWNPYAFSGTPLLAGMQSGGLYPLNVIFLILPFNLGWNVYIVLQLLLGSVFMYLFLRNLKVSELPSILGSIGFVFSGFAVSWLEWGNVLHTAIWLPLILFTIDKILQTQKTPNTPNIPILHLSLNSTIVWCGVFVFSLISSFFAGHLQTFFYLCLFSFCYLLARWYQAGRKVSFLFPFAGSAFFFVILTIPQWYPTMQFLSESARAVDQADWTKAGWFIPWQHLIQFIAPDFFGNPATLNYFGVWNYAEFVGYIGILPFVFALYAVMTRRDKKTIFFGLGVVVPLIFALPTFLSELPYQWSIPFLSTSQPTRLVFLIDFSLSVLAALGFDYLLKAKKKHLVVFVIPFLVVASIWLLVLIMPETLSVGAEFISIAKRNLQLPTMLLVATLALIMLYVKLPFTRLKYGLLLGMLLLTIMDLYRFSYKFTPMTDQAYVYPTTKSIAFLQDNIGFARYMALDSRILPPNFSVMYQMQSVDGYDPLYLTRYGELIIASERGKPDINPPFGFNRIITPHNLSSPIINLLGVKYVLSLGEMTNPSLKEVFREGETRVYENTQALPRAFFVTQVTALGGEQKEKAINFLFETADLQNKAVVEASLSENRYASGSASIQSYTPTKVTIAVTTQEKGFLILTDSYYPTWRARLLDTTNTFVSDLTIYRTDYHFRGVIVPKGNYIVEFTDTF